MSKELSVDDKGRVRAKNQEVDEPQKSQGAPAGTRHGNLDASAITHLQQTVGNSAVQTLLAQRKGPAGGGTLDEETANQIQSKQGQGQKLERGIARKAGRVMGQDFSQVNIHTDPQANQLNDQLGAKAFTTGRDIFFRQGEYNPTSGEGQKLISHELTHVVQQGGHSQGGVQTKMTVNDPNDQFEGEADRVAQKVTTSQPVAMRDHAEDEEQVQMQEDEEQVQMQEDEEQVQMQEDEEQVQMQEDEEQVQMQEDEEQVQMQEDEEQVQMQEDEEQVQMQEDEEQVQMQEDEEQVQMQEDEEQVQMQEDEEQVQMQEDEEQVQMQEDEEQVQMQEDEEQVQMQEDEEQVQMQETPEEEEAMKQ